MTTAHLLALALADDLASGSSKGTMLRRVRQFVMGIDRSADPAELIAESAPPTGDRRWDALVAGVVEDVAVRRGVATPAWTRDASRYLDEWWFVTDFPALRPWALKESPAAIANHGVFIRRAALANV